MFMLFGQLVILDFILLCLFRFWLNTSDPRDLSVDPLVFSRRPQT